MACLNKAAAEEAGADGLRWENRQPAHPTHLEMNIYKKNYFNSKTSFTKPPN
jgi:hypothetical protein